MNAVKSSDITSDYNYYTTMQIRIDSSFSVNQNSLSRKTTVCNTNVAH